MSISNLQIVGANYERLRYEIISCLEGNERNPYFDTKGKITIGVGFNIDDPTVRGLVLNALGLTASQKAVISTAWESPEMSAIRAKTGNARDQALQKFLNDKLLNSPSFTMTDTQISSVFKILVQEHEKFNHAGLISPPSSRENCISEPSLQHSETYWDGPNKRIKDGRSLRGSSPGLVSNTILTRK